MKNIKTWRERADERGIGSCEARDEEITELRHKLAAREADILDLSAQFRAKLDPLQAKLSELEGQEPAYLLTPGGYVVGARLDAGHAPGTLIKLYLEAGAQPPTVLVQQLINDKVALQAELDSLKSQSPVAQCLESDTWNCKYCRKTTTCEAIKDQRNFGIPGAQPPQALLNQLVIDKVEFHTEGAAHENTNSTC